MWADLSKRLSGGFWQKMMTMGISLSIDRNFMIFIRNSDRFLFSAIHLFLKKSIDVLQEIIELHR